MGLELGWHCSLCSSGRSQEEAGRLHPRSLHAISRLPSPEQLLAAVEPWCAPMSRPLSSAMLSPPQLATASVDFGWKLLAVSDTEDGAHRLVCENLHLLAQEAQQVPGSWSSRMRLAWSSGSLIVGLVQVQLLLFPHQDPNLGDRAWKLELDNLQRESI